MKKLFIVFTALLIAVAPNIGFSKSLSTNSANPGNRGSITFKMKTDKTYRNAFSVENYEQELFKILGLGTCSFAQVNNFVYIAFVFEGECEFTGFYIASTEIPGPQEYIITFTWDGENGKVDLFLNGVSFRKEKTEFYRPFKVQGNGSEIEIAKGNIIVENIRLSSDYSTPEMAAKEVPASLMGKTYGMLGGESLPELIDVEGIKGEMLYAAEDDIKNHLENWIVEGPAVMEFENDELILSSEIPNPPDGSTGHFNLWCPDDFPDNVIIEWEFMPLTDYGACHLFFASKGIDGRDLFDPDLQKRDGHYFQYMGSDITNYYVIYYSNVRDMRASNLATCWLIKSNAPSALSFGTVGVEPGIHKYHRMRLTKIDGHIQLSADGIVCVDFTDDGSERFGEIWKDGKIGFRQMARMKAKYRNINIWGVKK